MTPGDCAYLWHRYRQKGRPRRVWVRVVAVSEDGAHVRVELPEGWDPKVRTYAQMRLTQCRVYGDPSTAVDAAHRPAPAAE